MKPTLAAVGTVVLRTVHNLIAIIVLAAAFTVGPNAAAQQQSGCFAGKDHLGYPAKIYVNVERYGDWFEVAGQIYSSGANRVYKFKADGHSGAGRLYQGHEYESGALYISVRKLTESDLVLEVESYGVFYFRRTRC